MKYVITELIVVFLLCVLLAGAFVAWVWYRAGVQVAVYERGGVHMTRWEVFMGATPAVRVQPN